MAWITASLIVWAALVCLPCLVLFIQCFVAMLPLGDRSRFADVARPRLGVLVPAHNEEGVIAGTLESIRGQLDSRDRLLVIADNCSDRTAQVAAEAGARVLERIDPARRGKGYALEAGLQDFGSDPPDVVIVVDADCRLLPECLETLAVQAAATGRPAQACYLMTPPAVPRGIDVISSLAVLVKNRVRPLGMAKLGLPCLITGSGSAFPWKALESRPFDRGNIVEDMQLSVDLALAGYSPRFCDSAVVLAGLPESPAAFVSQRRRWEHGHLQTLLTQAPRLLAAFIRTGRAELAAMTADLAVPPLSLLAAINVLSLAVTLAWAVYSRSVWPAGIAVGAAGILAASVWIAWWRFARDRVPLRTLLTVPGYILAKLPLYATFIFRRQRAWVRTTRGSSAAGTLD